MIRCNDDGLKQKRKVALEQAQRRIDRREAEARKVEASGNAAKVKKAQRNLESARKAYAEIECPNRNSTLQTVSDGSELRSAK